MKNKENFSSLKNLPGIGKTSQKKKVRESDRKQILALSFKSDLVVPSYDQKTKKVKYLKSNDSFNVNVWKLMYSRDLEIKVFLIFQCFSLFVFNFHFLFFH